MLGEIGLDAGERLRHLALEHAFARRVAGQRTAGEVVVGGIADFLRDRRRHVAQIDEARGQIAGEGGGGEAKRAISAEWSNFRMGLAFSAFIIRVREIEHAWAGLSRQSTPCHGVAFQGV